MNPLKAQIEASVVAKLVEIFPPEEDEQALWDAIRAATNFEEALSAVVSGISEAKAMAAAIKTRADDMAIRKARFDARAEKLREFAAALMFTAKLSKAELPEATLSIGKKPLSCIITDDTRIPENFIRITRAPDKKAILDALKAGDAVPGAALSNGGETLIIRSR